MNWSLSLVCFLQFNFSLRDELVTEETESQKNGGKDKHFNEKRINNIYVMLVI
jgi:hypothetical protein